MSIKSALYIGHVYHKRHQPFVHKFKYRVFTLCIELDELEEFSARSKIFSLNKWNILSLSFKNHGRRDGSAIRPWIEKAARAKKIDIEGGKIFMITFPRLWGYVFNPLTVYYCYDRDQALKGILYQVKNTFGEQHGYLLPVVEKISEDSGHISQSTQKEFYVSPFIQMDCRYDFVLKEPDDTLDIAIHQFQADGKILTATWGGVRRDLTDKELLKALILHPLMSLKIITAIHWEALWIWIKGAKFFSRPPLPNKDVS